jgi:hypothetical protein
MKTQPNHDLPPELESAVRKYVASRCKLWSLLLGIPSLLLFLFGFTMLVEARRERADVVRFGMPLEIYNPAWGTVIDGVDPAIFPSRDPRDGRRGALVQQYIPLSNEQQLWELRRHKASPTPATSSPEPLPDLEPLPK